MDIMRDHLADVIIPVIHSIYLGNSHTDAIKEISIKLKYSPKSKGSTVYERCTRHLGLRSIHDFMKLVHSDKIEQHLINKFPDRRFYIEQQFPK